VEQAARSSTIGTATHNFIYYLSTNLVGAEVV
jgi:hypothetical protein